MAHNFVEGVDRIAVSNLQGIWHRVETLAKRILAHVAPTGDAEADALAQAAHVWPADADNDVDRMVDLQTVEGVAVPGWKATLSPSGRILGVVTGGYHPISGRAVFSSWLLALVRAGGIPETLGTFNAGRDFFGTVRTADAWHVPGDHSETVPYFSLTGNHTMDRGVNGMFESFRVQCANTAGQHDSAHAACTSAQDRAQSAWVCVQHRASAEERMVQAVAWIVDGRSRAESEKAYLARLAARMVTRAEVDRFLAQYVAIPADATPRQVTIRQEQRDQFLATLQDTADLGNHALTSAGISAYGLLQGVSRFEDWVSATRGRGDDAAPVATRRAFRAFLGAREPEKQAARLWLREAVGI